MNSKQEIIWAAMDELLQTIPQLSMTLGEYLETSAPPEVRKMTARLVRCSCCGNEDMMVELTWRRDHLNDPMEPHCPACDGTDLDFVPLN